MLLRTGEYLFLQEDKGNTLVIVKSGMLLGYTQENKQSPVKSFGPGTIIGEMSLLESAPRDLTVRAAEDSEITFVEQSALKEHLDCKPAWIMSTLLFLTSHLRGAEANFKKKKTVQAVPSLLYILKSLLEHAGSDVVPTGELLEKMRLLVNAGKSDIEELIGKFEELGILAREGNCVRLSNLETIPMLYDAIRDRALTGKVSARILTITDQLVLNAFTKIVEEECVSVKNGQCEIPMQKLSASAKKLMFGGSLTERNLLPLIRKGILNTVPPMEDSTRISEIETVSGDLEFLLSLQELNRIYPQLDKKLIQ